MNIARAVSTSTKLAPADYFTGSVWLANFGASAGAKGIWALRVTFEPRARTAWHTHPRGQLLHIISGVARVQRAGGPVLEAFPGDTVWIEPGERHWHGAAPDSMMVHYASQLEDADGNVVTWLEKVTDAEYSGPIGAEGGRSGERGARSAN